MTKLLVVDTETGGLDPFEQSILSLSGAVWEDGNLTDQCDVLIAEPQIIAQARALKINGMNIDDVRSNGLRPAQALEKWHNFLRKNFDFMKEKIQLVGHNVAFDIGFMKRLYSIANERAPVVYDWEDIYSHRTLDTAGIIRFLALGNMVPLTRGSLEEAIKHFGLATHQTHKSVDDVEMTGKLLTKLLELLPTYATT